MDSTFMGTMAGIALRLREIGQGELRVTNLNERNRDLLANLGLDQLFTMDGGGDEQEPTGSPVLPVVPQTPIGAQAVDKAEQAQTMIEAHEACIEANPAIAAKFKDALEYLKQDLHLVR